MFMGERRRNLERKQFGACDVQQMLEEIARSEAGLPAIKSLEPRSFYQYGNSHVQHLPAVLVQPRKDTISFGNPAIVALAICAEI